jgi:WD40 repeat protein
MRVPSGQVKVLDFGLARFVAEPGGAAGAARTPTLLHLTGAGAVMGTADYIAPEQARDAHGADARADVYSLGCTLYHLLAGRPPFPGGTAAEKLRRHAAEEPTPLPALRPEVPEGLAAVVGRMMAKRPEDRYPTAAAAAEALRPYADAVYPANRKRRRLAAVALAALAAVLLAAAVVRLSAGKDREIVIETDDPEIEVVVKGDRIVRIADPKTGKAYQIDRADLTLALAGEPDGLQVALDGGGPVVLKRHGQRIAVMHVTAKATAGGGEPSEQQADGPGQGLAEEVGEVRRFGGSQSGIGRVYFLPQGDLALASGQPVSVWNTRTGRKVRDLAQDLGRHDFATAVSADGRLALTGTHLWDLRTGKELRTLEGENEFLWGIAFSPDGRRAVFGAHGEYEARANTLWISDVNSGVLVRRLGNGDAVRSVAYSPDGRLIAAGHYFVSDNARGATRVYEAQTGKVLRTFETPTAAGCLAFSPDGKKLLCANNKTLRLWDLGSGKQLTRLDGHTAGAWWAAFTPDGRRIVSGGDDYTVRAWDAVRGKQLHCFTGHTACVLGVAVSPDGRYALSGSRDGTLRVWRLPETPLPAPADGTGQEASEPEAEPPGSPPLQKVAEVRRWTGHTGHVHSIVVSADGRTAWSAGNDLRQWELPTGRLIKAVETPTWLDGAALSPDEKQLITTLGWPRGELRLYSNSSRLQYLRGFGARNGFRYWQGCWTPDGRYFLTGGDDGIARLWDIGKAEVVRRFGGHESAVCCVAVNAEGTLVLTGSSDGPLLLQELKTGNEVRRFASQINHINSAQFTPDGRGVLTCGQDGVIRLFDTRTGRETRAFRSPGKEVLWDRFCFPPGGRFFLSAASDMVLRLWELDTGKEVYRADLRHLAVSLAVTPDGQFALIGTTKGEIIQCRLPTLPPPSAKEDR